jgi:uncharacterized MAPEG superfamily protein
MDISATYGMALWGIFVIVATLVLQMLVASVSKAKQAGAVPGKIDAGLSHDSFVFRSNRTFMNSVENAPAVLGASFLAVLAGADPFWAGVLIWVYAIARLLHMALYYGIATETNPSPRSYFFLIGFAATIGLLLVAALALA